MLCGTLARSGFRVRAAVRDGRPRPADAAEHVIIGDLGPDLDWREALTGVDSVVHLAARAHILGDPAANSVLYRVANALGTLNLSQQSAAAGVGQFVFLSSVKVNGEVTASRAFTAHDEPRPRDAYGLSKWEAERFVTEVGARTGMGVGIIRPPLVYGPGVKANFLKLMRWVDREKILPLGAVNNKRSFVSVWNLCDLILRLLAGPAALTGVWMVSDGQDVSTPELIKQIAKAMERRARMPALPVSVLQFLGYLSGHRPQVDRLCGSLVVDITDTRTELGWSPPVSLAEGLERTARWYLSGNGVRGG